MKEDVNKKNKKNRVENPSPIINKVSWTDEIVTIRYKYKLRGKFYQSRIEVSRNRFICGNKFPKRGDTIRFIKNCGKMEMLINDKKIISRSNN